jgi:hypothetical protein
VHTDRRRYAQVLAPCSATYPLRSVALRTTPPLRFPIFLWTIVNKRCGQFPRECFNQCVHPETPTSSAKSEGWAPMPNECCDAHTQPSQQSTLTAFAGTGHKLLVRRVSHGATVGAVILCHGKQHTGVASWGPRSSVGWHSSVMKPSYSPSHGIGYFVSKHRVLCHKNAPVGNE